MKQFVLALLDLRSGLSKFRVWWNLGFIEVRLRYQRSVLGPWWVSISMLIFMLVLSVVFSKVFAVNFREYMLYFSSGYVIWAYISSYINESTELFRQNAGYIKQINLPLNLYIFKFFAKSIVVFFHNFIVFVVILLLFRSNPGWISLLAVPGFIVLSLNLYWMSLVVALVSTRFRDMVPIINSCVQVLFFATPITWDYHLLGSGSKIVRYNLFSHFIDLVREPLLGRWPDSQSWAIAFLTALFGIPASLIVFSRIRTRVPFWVD